MDEFGSGAGADICPDDGSKQFSTSELDVALEKLSSHQYVCQWESKMSIFQLLYIFCLPELQGLLESIKLLSSMAKDVHKLCLRCFERGEISQLGALLLFAWDSSMDPSDGELFRRSLWAQRDLMKLQMFEREELVTQKLAAPLFKNVEISMTRKNHINCAFRLLRVLERSHSSINSYRGSKQAERLPKCYVPYDVALLIWGQCVGPPYRHGIDMALHDVECDNIPCLLEGEDIDALNEALETHMSWASETPDVPVFSWENYWAVKYGEDVNEEDVNEEDVNEEFETWISDHNHLDPSDKYALDLQKAVEFDRKDDFLKLICLAKCKEDISDRIPLDILSYDAVNCFAAVLAGETGDLLSLGDIVSRFEDIDMHLLFAAAAWQSEKIGALLLEKGFAEFANVEGDYGLYLRVLPLNMALYKLRVLCMRDWTGETAVELVIRLCDWELRDQLEFVRLLAMKTMGIEVEFIEYLKKGMMVEVGALLLLAHKKLLTFGASGLIVQNILSSRDTHSQAEEGLPLVLLDIFSKVGDKLQAYVQLKRESMLLPEQVASEVATIIQGAGITVRHKELYIRSRIGGIDSRFENTVMVKRDVNQDVEESWMSYMAKVRALFTKMYESHGCDHLSQAKQIYPPICTFLHDDSLMLVGSRIWPRKWAPSSFGNPCTNEKSVFKFPPLGPSSHAVRMSGKNIYRSLALYNWLNLLVRLS